MLDGAILYNNTNVTSLNLSNAYMWCTCKLFVHRDSEQGPLSCTLGLNSALSTTGPWPLLKDDSLFFGLTSSRYGQPLCNRSSPWGQSVCQSLLTEQPSHNPHLNHLSYTRMHRNSKAVIPSGQGWNATYRYAMALSQETCQNKTSLTSLTRHTGRKEAIRDSKCPIPQRAFLSYHNS